MSFNCRTFKEKHQAYGFVSVKLSLPEDEVSSASDTLRPAALCLPPALARPEVAALATSSFDTHFAEAVPT